MRLGMEKHCEVQPSASMTAQLPPFLRQETLRGSFPSGLDVVWELSVAERFQWEVKASLRDNPQLFASARAPMREMPEIITLEGPLAAHSGAPLRVTPKEVFDQICGGYNFTQAVQSNSLSNKPLRVAFTVLSGSQMGGGTIQLYRYANWLTDLGCAVTIYSDDKAPPSWASLKGNYVFIEDKYERYRAISEDLVIVYSILELPAFLQAASRKAQRVLHMCQGLEEFHFGADASELLTDKPIFKLLNALPVGRIVVSPALLNYFQREFQQECFFIPNGIDPIFNSERIQGVIPPAYGENNRPIKLLQIANPGHMLKGAKSLFEAVRLLGQLYVDRRLNLHVTFVSGPTPRDSLQALHAPAGVSYSIKSCLTPTEMKAEYQSADIVVNASIHEGFGLSTIEALASGAQVVQADNFGYQGVVSDHKEVLVVPPNDPIALATAIGALLASQELRQSLKDQVGGIAETFSIKRQGEAFAQEMSRILGVPCQSLMLLSRPLAEREEFPRVAIRERPHFSVLVPVYNHARFLPTTLDTLRTQTYPLWEAVLVNDGSTDGTAEIMASYAARDARFKTVHQSNGGTAAALNTALRHSRKEWICWLSSDDFFKPDKLEVHAQFIESFPEYRFFHSDYREFNDHTNIEDTVTRPTHVSGVNPAHQTLDFFQWNYVHGNTIAIHRDVFARAGEFRKKFPNAQDFDMWLRMSVHERFFYINKVTCVTRVHPEMGTRRFPIAGGLDSYRALAEFISQHRFPELCRFADFSSVEGIQGLMFHLLKVALQPKAFLYQGVLSRRSPLLERFHELLNGPEVSEPYRKMLLRFFTMELQNKLGRGEISDAFKRPLEMLLQPEKDPGFSFERIDPVRELVGSYEHVLRQKMAKESVLLFGYLMRLRSLGVADVPDLNLLCGSPEVHGLAASL